LEPTRAFAASIFLFLLKMEGVVPCTEFGEKIKPTCPQIPQIRTETEQNPPP
jgi:hypothetical protein